MNLKDYIQSLTDDQLNNEMKVHYFDFRENREHVIATYKYCLKDPTRISKLYIDMGNNGHNVFEDAIRFKFIKLVECFKKVSNIMRIKFYGDLPKESVFDTMNKDILENESTVEYLNELIDDRNSMAHETDSYEFYMFEHESENIKFDLDFLTCIFLSFIGAYESKMGINLIKEEWQLLTSESDMEFLNTYNLTKV